jgi:uncharacterized protein YraI
MDMKHKALFVTAVLIASLFAAYPTLAQDSQDYIVLNDATPGIDAVITPAPGTTGVVAVELFQAAVTVTDAAGNVVFQLADPRVHEFELRLAPGTGSYTLSAVRLPGITEAFVRVVSQADLTQIGETTLITDSDQALGMRQSIDLPLTPATPSQVTAVKIPTGRTGTLQVSFPGAPVMAQVVDRTGLTVATLNAGFDGLSLVLDGGQYELTLLNTVPTQETMANMQIMPALPSDLAGMLPEMVAQSDGQITPVSTEACLFTVGTASVNLRSGPGTGYSVIDYGFRDEQFPVGGMNPNGSWLVLGTGSNSSAWVARTLGSLTGGCENLTVYNTPYREAPAPQVIVEQAPAVVQAPSIVQQPSSPSGGSGEHDDDEGGHDDDD